MFANVLARSDLSPVAQRARRANCIAAIDPAIANAKSIPPSVNDLIFSTISGSVAANA